jgi:proprotein convertase subtilisin/kexin type 5
MGLYLYPGNNTCVLNCPTTNYYTDSTLNKCVPCDNKCLVCWGPATNCTSCTTSGPNQGYYLSTNRSCLSNCPNKYFKNSSTHVCDSCDPSCYKCTGTPSPCTVCSITYSLYLTTCLTSCPPFFYSEPDVNLNGSFVCVACDPAC